MDVFIEEARKLYASYPASFYCANFLDFQLEAPVDYCISSGIFNHKMETDNYLFIEKCIAKALEISRDGLAFDFLSNKVDFELEHTFHSDPAKILDIAYSYSRNIVLRNDYMPFEFALFIFKNDYFEKSETLFARYKELHHLG